MAIQLVTDQLSTELDDTFRTQLVGDFKVIEKALNDLSIAVGKDNTNQQSILTKQLTDMQQQMNDKINRITLGTDEDTIRLVVTAILQEQGVIK
ncbi:hypothetical protein ABC426_17390 [Lactiplantibacillus plantarum]|uniref:hypothetical protein n=1 Tax=Lactiplantibacillus plantarum TaxID=1590 RepID=UPI001BA8F0F0|nr:hypothetical protein [Lactiplantibacillus plantarum]MBS0953044.1 hypothetical protein [Lactiplantibacillus plantarum]